MDELVTTTDQIKALPVGTLLTVPVYGGHKWPFRWDGHTLISTEGEGTRTPGWLLDHYGPMTLVRRG